MFPRTLTCIVLCLRCINHAHDAVLEIFASTEYLGHAVHQCIYLILAHLVCGFGRRGQERMAGYYIRHKTSIECAGLFFEDLLFEAATKSSGLCKKICEFFVTSGYCGREKAFILQDELDYLPQ